MKIHHLKWKFLIVLLHRHHDILMHRRLCLNNTLKSSKEKYLIWKCHFTYSFTIYPSIFQHQNQQWLDPTKSQALPSLNIYKLISLVIRANSLRHFSSISEISSHHLRQQIRWKWVPLTGCSVLTTSIRKDRGCIGQNRILSDAVEESTLIYQSNKRLNSSPVNFINGGNSAVHLNSSVANNTKESLSPWTLNCRVEQSTLMRLTT